MPEAGLEPARPSTREILSRPPASTHQILPDGKAQSKQGLALCFRQSTIWRDLVSVGRHWYKIGTRKQDERADRPLRCGRKRRLPDWQFRLLDGAGEEIA